jgi:hypothetical protein
MARLLFLFISFLSLVGCVSHSTKSVSNLDQSKKEYLSEECKAVIKDADLHDDLKVSRLVLSPTIIFLSAGVLAIPVIAANAGFDTFDHLSASDISSSCGGVPREHADIAIDVAKDAAVGFATGGIKFGQAASSGK